MCYTGNIMTDFKFKNLAQNEYSALREWDSNRPEGLSNLKWQRQLGERFLATYRETIGRGSVRRVLKSKSFNDYHDVGIVSRLKNLF